MKSISALISALFVAGSFLSISRAALGESVFSQGVFVGAGIIQANKVGPSLLGGYKLELPFGSWGYVSVAPTLSYTFNSYTRELWLGPDAYNVQNTDTQRILGLSVDPFLGLNIVGPVSLEVGGNLGVASNAAKSTYCGNETYLAGYVGLEGGLALRVGARKQYQASVHATMVTLPALRCSEGAGLKSPSNPTGIRLYHERDFETVGALMRLGVSF